MKKSLLLASFAIFATVASAQTVVCLATSEDLAAAGLSSDKVTIPGGTIIVDGDAGTFSLAYEDSWGATTTYKGYRNVYIGGEQVELGSGAVGNTNPTFQSYQAGVMSAGAVFQIEAKKDGWMTVFTKMNPNKQYLVFEGKKGALSYTLGWADGTQQIYYTTPHDADEMIDFTAPDASKYFIAAQKQSTNEAGDPLWKDKDGNIVAGERPVWTDDNGKEQKGAAVMEDIEPREDKPEFPWKVAGFDKAPGESTGFLSFSVLAGNTYYFSALGSKAACGGFVFTEGDAAPGITYCAYDEVDKETGEVKASYPEVTFGEGGSVESVAVAADENAPIYNMMGVRVNADAKGILIQNGKKFIRK